jgi:hypothetical protein
MDDSTAAGREQILRDRRANPSKYPAPKRASITVGTDRDRQIYEQVQRGGASNREASNRASGFQGLQVILPEQPALPEQLLLPDPDNAALRAAKEREMARRLAGRSSTILTGGRNELS